MSVTRTLRTSLLTQVEGRCDGKEGEEEEEEVESDDPPGRDGGGGRVPESRESVTLQLQSSKHSILGPKLLLVMGCVKLSN